MNNLEVLQTRLDQERRKVDVDHFDITIREIVRMAEDKELIRAPEYQRKFRWSLEDESKLIESLFLGLPVPSIFVATNTNGTWEVVDGLQRISTLLHYISKSEVIFKEINKQMPLVLEKLEKLPEFNGKSFDDLPVPIQLAFYKRALRVTALSDKSDMVARFDLFERLNTGGIALSPQEVRSCIFQGDFVDFIKDLSDDEIFVSLVKLQDQKKNDGTIEEIVLKFFAYLYDRENFKGNVTGFLNNYMKKSSQDFDYEQGRLLFKETINVIHKVNPGFFLKKKVHVTPINQLEGVMVGIGEIIRNNGQIVLPSGDWINDKELLEFSTGGTNTKTSLEGRINRSIQIFSGQSEYNN